MLLSRVDRALANAFEVAPSGPQPPRKLMAAMRDAVFRGGGRLRPLLTLAVAEACGDPEPRLSEACAAAVELLHCASLVHDDLPCFDDASHRRGVPSVHRLHGEALAVLAGDALIVQAFDSVVGAEGPADRRLAAIGSLSASVGHRRGLIAGQAWESEIEVPVGIYHRAKTASLFEAAAVCGALSAGADVEPWRRMAGHLGEAYQIADDLADVLADPDAIGKPVGRDAELGRPTVLNTMSVSAALQRLTWLEWAALDAVPELPGAPRVRALLRATARRLTPSIDTQRAAAC